MKRKDTSRGVLLNASVHRNLFHCIDVETNKFCIVAKMDGIYSCIKQQ